MHSLICRKDRNSRLVTYRPRSTSNLGGRTLPSSAHPRVHPPSETFPHYIYSGKLSKGTGLLKNMVADPMAAIFPWLTPPFRAHQFPGGRRPPIKHLLVGLILAPTVAVGVPTDAADAELSYRIPAVASHNDGHPLGRAPVTPSELSNFRSPSQLAILQSPTAASHFIPMECSGFFSH